MVSLSYIMLWSGKKGPSMALRKILGLMAADVGKPQVSEGDKSEQLCFLRVEEIWDVHNRIILLCR